MTFLSVAIRFVLLGVGVLTYLLAVAGRPDFWPAWAWVGAMVASALATYGGMTSELRQERMRPPADRDRATRRLVIAPLVAHFTLAGLDARFGWSAVPVPVVSAGLAVFTLGFVLVGWTLLSNPFASSAVRIQSERAHRVISHGPYRLVRHPMYLAVVLVCSGSGFALASWWAGLALLPVLAIFIRRTALEDLMLRTELDGYAEYSSRVRWRVIPLIF